MHLKVNVQALIVKTIARKNPFSSQLHFVIFWTRYRDMFHKYLTNCILEYFVDISQDLLATLPRSKIVLKVLQREIGSPG